MQKQHLTAISHKQLQRFRRIAAAPVGGIGNQNPDPCPTVQGIEVVQVERADRTGFFQPVRQQVYHQTQAVRGKDIVVVVLEETAEMVSGKRHQRVADLPYVGVVLPPVQQFEILRLRGTEFQTGALKIFHAPYMCW